MVSLLFKKLASAKSLVPAYRHLNLTSFIPLFQFSTQIQQKEDQSFMAQYLISSFGFSEERAIKVASESKLSRIRTQDRPDSVVRFLGENGLTEKEIKYLISWNPQLLSSHVDQTLKPRVNELVTAGFSGNIVTQLIKNNPLALNLKSTLSVLQFWRSFVNNSEKDLLKVITNNQELVNVDINKKIIPRINLLREYGLSDQHIVMVIKGARILIQKDLDSIKQVLERVENLGFRRGSGMFIRALIKLGSLRNDTLERKIMLLRNTCDWCEEDVHSAIKRCPEIPVVSDEKIKSIRDFLVKKVGLEPREIALRPIVFTFSLNRRLMPRHYVIDMLNSKGLIKGSYSASTMCVSEKRFIEKFITPYNDTFPELRESYLALFDGKTP